MQREVGPQVASPLYLHQIQPLPPHAAAAARKRGSPWPAVEPPENAPIGAGAAAGGNWNPSMWDWDSRAFTARPSSDALRLGAKLSPAVDKRLPGPSESGVGACLQAVRERLQTNAPELIQHSLR